MTESRTGYRNEKCFAQKHLGVSLYYRCSFCNSSSRDCLSMRFNLASFVIILFLLLFPALGVTVTKTTHIFIVMILLWLGVQVNKQTDQLYVKQNSLDKRNDELAMLLDAATAISSELDLHATLNMLASRIVNASDCNFALIFLATDNEFMYTVETIHVKDSIIPASRYSINVKQAVDFGPESIVVSVLENNCPITLKETELQAMRNNMSLMKVFPCKPEDIEVLSIMPIHTKGIDLGVILTGTFRLPNAVQCPHEKLDMASSLVNHAGIAIYNAKLYESLQQMHLQTIMALSETLETRDAYTRNHSDRTIEYVDGMVAELNLGVEEANCLRYVAILHDVGKIGIPDSILNKPGKLTDRETLIMNTHPEKGENIVLKIPFLEHAAPGIRHHHERWDGNGYPDGLKGDEIPIEARIVAVLDSFDAIISDRVYRKALGYDYAVRELMKYSGTQFDPRVIDAFLKVIGVEIEIQREVS